MENLKKYNIIPVTQAVLQESLVEYSSPKDKLSSLTSEGLLLRLKRGLYSIPRTLTGQSLSRELIANHLRGPSYVSFESALSYHGLIAALYREGFFNQAAFYGGTCLRIFHGIKRFSKT